MEWIVKVTDGTKLTDSYPDHIAVAHSKLLLLPEDPSVTLTIHSTYLILIALESLYGIILE